MPKLEIYTNNLIIDGKPKVYLCFDERDYDRHFKHNVELLVEAAPTAVIFYVKEGREKDIDEEYAAMLSEMQLFVVLVTKNIIDDNSKIIRELELARDEGIPILPLMQDGLNAELFDKVIPAMQCLDEYGNEKSALPFMEKLKTRLDAILIGEQLADEIRKAFDAYIFISYRKKDREYAKQVMEEIHNDDFFLSVATWYDEFLVPGENYNEAIYEAMKKSKLFTLVVTPNVLEEGNYVVEHEYPDAKNKLKMNCVGVEMVSTDKKEVGDKFKGLDNIISLEDKEELRNLFLKSIGREALKDKSSDGQHLFYMGLAYLTGLDVTKNVKKGIELIERAASLNVCAAYEKLVRIYHLGEFGEKNIPLAQKWQDKYAYSLLQKLQESEDRETIIKYINARYEEAVMCIEFLQLQENRLSITFGDDKESEERVKRNREKIERNWLRVSTQCMDEVNRCFDKYCDAYDICSEYLRLCVMYYSSKDRFSDDEDLKCLLDYMNLLEEYINAQGDSAPIENRLVYAKAAYAYGLEILSRHFFEKDRDKMTAIVKNEVLPYLRKAYIHSEICIQINDSTDVMRRYVENANVYVGWIIRVCPEDDVDGLAEKSLRIAEKLYDITKSYADKFNLAKTYYTMFERRTISKQEKIDCLEQNVKILRELIEEDKSRAMAYQIELYSSLGILERLKEA